MKKIIAMAVAGAFVAPAFAANENFTFSGEFEYRYVSGDHAGQVDTSSIGSGDQTIYIEGATETESGLSIKAYMAINNDSDSMDSDGDTSITISGAFGSIELGDAASALDNVGDYTDVAPATGGFDADGGNANILYVLPTMVEGLKVSLSHSPEAEGAVENYADHQDQNSYSVAYGFSGGEVYYGVQDFGAAGAEDVRAYGVKASFGGLMVAAEFGVIDDGTTELDIHGLAATYKVGDATLIFENQDIETSATATTEETMLAVKYSLGGGLAVYAEAASIDATDNTQDRDFTTLGVNYQF
jgi:hypothetical protein